MPISLSPGSSQPETDTGIGRVNGAYPVPVLLLVPFFFLRSIPFSVCYFVLLTIRSKKKKKKKKPIKSSEDYIISSRSEVTIINCKQEVMEGKGGTWRWGNCSDGTSGTDLVVAATVPFLSPPHLFLLFFRCCCFPSRFPY